ncbi:hypothetical protein GW17_00049402, partial [Ensete ventricosum]
LLAEEIATATGEERRQMGRWDGNSGKAWCTAAGDSDAAGEVGCGQAGEEGGALGRRGCNDGTSASARRQRKNRGEAMLAVITEGWPQEKHSRGQQDEAAGMADDAADKERSDGHLRFHRGGEEDDARQLGREVAVERSNTSTMRETGERPPMERKEMNLSTMCSGRAVQKSTSVAAEAAVTLLCAGEVEGRDTAVGLMLRGKERSAEERDQQRKKKGSISVVGEAGGATGTT